MKFFKLQLHAVLAYLERRKFSEVLLRIFLVQVRSIRYRRKCNKTYSYIASYLPAPTLESVKINLRNIKISEVIPKSIPGYWQLNPTILRLNGVISLCWRATNGVFSPEANKLGKMKLSKSTSQIRNQILVGALDENFNLLSQRVVHNSIGVPSFEDPRGFDSEGSSLVVGTVVTEEPIQGLGKWRSSVGFLDICTGEIRTINNPKGKQIEKNWAPITIENSQLKLLYSTNPHVIAEVDPDSGEALFTTKTLDTRIPNLSGGSQFVKLPSGEFLRVGRRRLPVEGKGMVHFSYLMHYDEHLQLLRFSKPFIFRKVGFEICNGLMLVGDETIYFSWGEDDRKLYVMSAKLEEILSWLAIHDDRNFGLRRTLGFRKATRKLLMR